MKLSDPAVRHALIAALVIGAVAVIVFAVMPPHVAKTPLQGAQLAGTRGIRLEGEQPVPRFDDQRAPIVVAPPAQGQWSAFAVGMDQRVPLTIVVEPVDDVQRIRIQAPLPIGRWDLVLEDDARQTRWPVRFAKVPEPSAVIARLTVEAEALDVADRPAFWATVSAPAGMDRVSVKVAEARAWIAAGNLQAAAGAYETAAADAGAIGWISEQAGRLRAAAWAKLCVREFEATHALLDRAQRVIAITHDAWAQARVDYLRGCALRETGMFRDATAHLRQSGRVARQFADGRLTTTITNELATLYSDLGQYDAALALLQETPDAGEARGRRLNIRGWIAARAFKKDRSRWSQVRADLEGSLDHLTAPAERAIALTNLAAMDLQEGQLDAARDRLSELAKLPDDFAALHARLFEAEVARRTGEIDAAVRMYSALLKTAQTGFNDELIWQAALGLHRVARLRDRPADAQEWLTAAFAALEVRGRRAAVSNARATLLADRDDLIEASADFHLANGDATNALASLDATRAWVLRDLDARLRIERLPESEKSAWYGAQRTYQAARSALDDRLQSCARRPDDERAACDATVDGLRAAVQSAFDRLYAVLDRAAPSALKDARLPRIAPRRALFTAVALADKTVAFWMQGAQVTAAETRIDDPLAPFAHKLTGLDHLYVVGAV
ncbi:MAG: tetratricopeptide (TPR) repeat protein, partial [Bradymonadia bacterium]